MKKLTRRKLVTQASVGTGAVGLLTIAAACSSPSSANTSTSTNLNGNLANTLDEPLAVFVTDPAKGTLKIMRGDREIVVNNPSLANSLLALV